MNRIRQSADRPAQADVCPEDICSEFKASFEVNSALFSPATNDSPRAVFAPLHYTPKYDYPLIVWLHGPGGDQRQLLRIMPVVSLRNYIAVAPQGILTSPQEEYHSHLSYLRKIRQISSWPRSRCAAIRSGVPAALSTLSVRNSRCDVKNVACRPRRLPPGF